MDPISFVCEKCHTPAKTNHPKSIRETLKHTFSTKFMSLLCEKCRPYSRRTNWVRLGTTAIDHDGNEVMLIQIQHYLVAIDHDGNEVMLNLDLYRAECGKIGYEVLDHMMHNLDELTKLERSLPQQLTEYIEERRNIGEEVWVERKLNGERRDNLFWAYNTVKPPPEALWDIKK